MTEWALGICSSCKKVVLLGKYAFLSPFKEISEQKDSESLKILTSIFSKTARDLAN